MGSFGGFYAGEKKKKKKAELAKDRMQQINQQSYVPPKVEIIGKGKKKSF